MAVILLGGLGLRLLLGDPDPPRIFVYDGYGTAARFHERLTQDVVRVLLALDEGARAEDGGQLVDAEA